MRRAWGADESWRDGAPRYNTRLDQVHVHHTVNSNDYRRADVAPMIRGIYRYHTQSLGWSDIGYNFLVDRFGRAWEGRAGGWGRKVRGAHTLGFNENSTGVAVIGNFEQVRVPRAARWTLAQLVAWKLDAAGHRPGGTGRVWSHGSDRYPRGSRPRLPRTAGHRDTNQTACPGRLLYADLGGIRRAAQRRADRWS
nr:N-acetylmuramoyl-L-alanine amidase [Nocardioides perillae]